MLEQFASTFAAIGLAELGDKTQFAAFALSAKYHKKTPVILGAVLAFAVADAIAVILGSLFSFALPTQSIKIVAGVLFVLVGLYTLTFKEEQKSEKIRHDHSILLSSFTLIFLMEMGDKTQLANLLFATVYSPAIVWLASTLAMSLLAIAAVLIGKKLFTHIDERTVKIISGLLFVFVGVAVLLFG